MTHQKTTWGPARYTWSWSLTWNIKNGNVLKLWCAKGPQDPLWSFPRISRWNLTVLLAGESTMKTPPVCATYPLRANLCNAETIKCSSFYMLSELLHHSLKNLFSESCRCFSEEKKRCRGKRLSQQHHTVWKLLTRTFSTWTHSGVCIFINSSITPTQC